MWLLNWIYVGLVKIADLYARLRSPFDEFTRKANLAVIAPLIEKEQQFFDQLVSRFVVFAENKAIVWNYKRQSNGQFDLGDQALWHGVTTFMLCLRARAVPTAQMYDLVERSANGMLLHQHVNIEEKPRLIRGVADAGGVIYQDDASNDTLTGHLLGIYGLLKYSTGAARQTGVNLARNIADSIIDNNFCLTNLNGEPTTHGKLVNSYLTDGLNLSLCLVALKLASYAYNGMLLDYELPYQMLVKKYKQRIPYGYVTLDQIGHDYDAHRAMIAYSILADLEKDHDTNRLYIQGLIRGWKHDRKARNPWMYYLLRRIMLIDPNDWNGCLQRLAEIEPVNKMFVQERKNSGDEALWKERGIRFFEWRDKTRSSQPLPLWMVGSQDFFWQRSQYSVDEWLGMQPGELEHNGVDFMLCYWGFRELKFIP